MRDHKREMIQISNIKEPTRTINLNRVVHRPDVMKHSISNQMERSDNEEIKDSSIQSPSPKFQTLVRQPEIINKL